MKTVYQTREVLHLWAHGLGTVEQEHTSRYTETGEALGFHENGERIYRTFTVEHPRHIRNGGNGNVFAYGETCFSYGSHFPMAKRIMAPGVDYEIQAKHGKEFGWETECTESTERDARKQLKVYRDNVSVPVRIKRIKTETPVFLITDQSYSTTTAGHLSRMRSAIPPENFQIQLNPELWEGVKLGGGGTAIRSYFTDKIAVALEDANNTRCGFWRRNRGMERADELGNSWRKLHELFRFRCNVALPPVTLPDLTESRIVYDRAKVAINAEYRMQAEQYRAQTEFQKLEDKKRRELWYSDLLPRWKNGETVAVYREDRFDYMRTSGSVVETTQSARVPVGDVRDFLRVALPTLFSETEKNGAFHFPRVQIGPFSGITLEVTEDSGTVSVGCHKFRWDEIQRIAGILGVDLPEPPWDLIRVQCNRDGCTSPRVIHGMVCDSHYSARSAAS